MSAIMEETKATKATKATFGEEFKELVEGVIYMLKNKVNGKIYIGQAPKYYGSNKQKWGLQGRLTRHVYEANKLGFDQLIKEAIEKFGIDNFESSIIHECHKSQLDKWEKHYISVYQCMDPDGYNMTSGGKDGFHSAEANLKNKIGTISGRINKQSDEVKKAREVTKKEGKNQTTIRAEAAENNEKVLAKYIIQMNKEVRIRKLDQISPSKIVMSDKKFLVEYQSCNGEIFKKKFENLKDAEIFLQNVSNNEKLMVSDYQYYNSAIDSIFDNMDSVFFPLLTYSNIFPIVYQDTICGYFVYGLVAHDGSYIPLRKFTENQNTYNLQNACKFIDQVKQMNLEKMVANDWLNLTIEKRKRLEGLPKYIRTVPHNTIGIKGYRVDYPVGYNEKGRVIQKSKTFTEDKLTLEEKLELAKKHVAKMDEIYKGIRPIARNSSSSSASTDSNEEASTSTAV